MSQKKQSKKSHLKVVETTPAAPVKKQEAAKDKPAKSAAKKTSKAPTQRASAKKTAVKSGALQKPKKTTKTATAKKPAKKAAAVAKKKAPTRKASTSPKSAAKRTAVKAAKNTAAAQKAGAEATQKAVSEATNITTKVSAEQEAATLNALNFLKETLMPTTKPNFQFEQLAQDAANTSRENVEAFFKSGAIFAKGFETILKTAASMSQDAAEKQAQYAKEIFSSKTPNEAVEAQNKIAQANFDNFMSSATKLSEMSVKLLSESAAPINEQVTKSVQKASKLAA